MDSMEDSGFDSDPKPSQNGDIGRVAEVSRTLTVLCDRCYRL